MIRLAIRVARAEADLVLAELAELAPGGLEERDVDAGTVEFALYGAPGELPPLPDLRAAAGSALVDVSTTELADDWDVRWRAWHPTVVVEAGGRSLCVRPTWEAPRAGSIDVAIEPAQAFGTGSHETTRLSLALLLESAPAGPLADWGCGSGVLAIAAAKLGFGPVTAIDADLAALEATERNARENGVVIDAVERVNLRDDAPPAADVVVANLMRPLLLRLAPRLVAAAPRVAIISGLLDAEAEEVVAAFGPALGERRRLSSRGWSTVMLELVED